MTCNALSQQFLGIVRIIVINSIITLHDSMRAENKASLMPKTTLSFLSKLCDRNGNK